jgi:hypothetical protein
LPGEYKVIIERSGFDRWTGRITIERNKTAKLTVTLIEKPSSLTVRVRPPGARVTIDDAPHDPLTSITISAGRHQVAATLAGHRPARLETSAHEGKPIELEVVRVLPASRLTPRRRLALALGGGGLAVLGGAIWLGRRAGQLDQDAYALCPSPAIPCTDALKANDLNQRGRSHALQANIAYAAGGAAAVAAAVLWFIGAPESRIAITTRIGGGTGVGLAGRF